MKVQEKNDHLWPLGNSGMPGPGSLYESMEKDEYGICVRLLSTALPSSQCLELFRSLSIGVMQISPCHAIGNRWFEFLTTLLFPEPSVELNSMLGPIRRHLNTAVSLSDYTELQDVKLPLSFKGQLLPPPWIQFHVGEKLRQAPLLSPHPTIHGKKSRLKGWWGSGPLCICWMILR